MQAQQNATYSDRIQIREQRSLPAIPSRESGRGYVSARTIQPPFFPKNALPRAYSKAGQSPIDRRTIEIVAREIALWGKHFTVARIIRPPPRAFSRLAALFPQLDTAYR